MRIDALRSGFRLLLDDGEELDAARVVVAAGISPFAWRPPQFRALPQELVSHSSETTDLARFAGRTVAVVGAGQSALESAALLHEAGAEVEVLIRADSIHWLARSAWLHNLGPDLTTVVRADGRRPGGREPCGSGARLGQAASSPAAGLARYTLHSPRRRRLAGSPPGGGAAHDPPVGRLRDGGRGWRRTQAGRGERAAGRPRGAGHGISRRHRALFVPRPRASGLGAAGRRAIHASGAGSSRRCGGCISSERPAAWSFGPLMRFVAGTEYAAASVARHVLGRASSAAWQAATSEGGCAAAEVRLARRPAAGDDPGGARPHRGSPGSRDRPQPRPPRDPCLGGDGAGRVARACLSLRAARTSLPRWRRDEAAGLPARTRRQASARQVGAVPDPRRHGRADRPARRPACRAVPPHLALAGT